MNNVLNFLKLLNFYELMFILFQQLYAFFTLETWSTLLSFVMYFPFCYKSYFSWLDMIHNPKWAFWFLSPILQPKKSQLPQCLWKITEKLHTSTPIQGKLKNLMQRTSRCMITLYHRQLSDAYSLCVMQCMDTFVPAYFSHFQSRFQSPYRDKIFTGNYLTKNVSYHN
jgi:hypothetical protein